jgi:hypothetical protein
MGALTVFIKTGSPAMWSECSWVRKMPSSRVASSPMAWRRARISFRFNPASIRIRVVGLAMNIELPALDEASTQMRTMASS